MAKISKKLFSIPLLVFSTTIFLMLVSSVNSLDSLFFSFTEFELDERDLIFQGDSHLKSLWPFIGNELQLTKTDGQGAPQKNTIGRVLYSAPFQLWQKRTGKVSKFEAQMGFELKKPSSKPGDGFAFFIAPIDSTIPENTKGGYLGLFNDTTAFNSSATTPIVAVEFDTYFYDAWDPNYPHIGINVNSINSSTHVKWNREAEETLDIDIKYDPHGRNLSVVAFGFDGVYAVSYKVDLPNVLPEWVRVGITGASGDDGVEVHNVYTWSFSSHLESIQ
ncbi:unnamed protein product [Lupinus luteus]|uniref:Legume lectin domain-containing protein n=1 Tax=Lupinus luteus TaxID=3873 RepID=A0AAV1XFP4_LUPLU